MRLLLFLFLLSSVCLSSQEHEVVASGLEVPWDLVFLPDGSMLITERPGRLTHLLGEGRKSFSIETTYHRGEGGLMGLALHPKFEETRWIYLYNTVKKGGKTFNRVERYRFEEGGLSGQKILIDSIPAASYHDGGRIAFGPDDYLYITTGDAFHALLAQDLTSLAGKILRLDEEGGIPPDNPFHSPVYSYGHRNPQGLTWDPSGRLWSTEHGPSGMVGGRDELNLIEKGKNYGWPHITGDESRPGMETPILQSGWLDTWAPASALYWDGSIFFGGLRGQALFEAQVQESPIRLKSHFKGRFGRLRTVVLGPDGYFYMMTSNRDGRGWPERGDDRVIKLHPRLFRD